MTKTILVLGASGTVGRPLVARLRAAGAVVRAASRSGEPVDGAEGVRFDFQDEATFDAAFAGADAAYVLLPTGYVDAKGLLIPVVETAKRHGTKVVFQSVFGVDADDSIPYRQVELAIEGSGLRSVILRPNWFADNFHTFWKAGIDQGAIAVPAGEGKTSFIDARDIAESAAAALLSDRFDGRAFDLTGPAALGYDEAAAILSRQIGRPVTYHPLDDEAFVALLTGNGAPEDYARFLAGIFHPVRAGWTARVTDAVETLTGHPPRNLETYSRDNQERFAL